MDLISCNVCDGEVDGIAYKTNCCPLLCSLCATKAFTSGQSCPVCSNLLSESDITEIEIGSKHIEKISDTLNRQVFRSKDWRQITDNITLEIENLKQLLSVETKKNDGIIATIKSSHNQEKYQFQQKIMTLEEELNKRDDELNELKLAYKEKMRKCVAWEKAYNSLRGQLSDQQEATFRNRNSTTGSNRDAYDFSASTPIPCSDRPGDFQRNSENNDSLIKGSKFIRRTEVTTIRSNINNGFENSPQNISSNNSINNVTKRIPQNLANNRYEYYTNNQNNHQAINYGFDNPSNSNIGISRQNEFQKGFENEPVQGNKQFQPYGMGPLFDYNLSTPGTSMGSASTTSNISKLNPLLQKQKITNQNIGYNKSCYQNNKFFSDII